MIDVVKLVAAGIVVGLIGAAALVRNTFLSWYSLGAVELLAYAFGAVIAISVALLASLPSAFRAATVEPVVAMRSE